MLHYVAEAVKILYEHKKDCKIDLKDLTERERDARGVSKRLSGSVFNLTPCNESKSSISRVP